MFLVQQRAARLTAKAQEEIATLENEWNEESDDKEKWKVKKSVDAMFAGLRVPAKKGTPSTDLEYKVEAIQSGTEGQAASTNGARENGDVVMGGTEFHPRTTLRSSPPESSYLSSRQILSALSNDLKELVDRGASEMVAYDAHAKQVIALYQSALDRRTTGGRRESLPKISTSMSPTSTSGVGGNGGGGVQSPADIRKFSTGMPFPGFIQQPARVKETMEELIRRGSR